MSYYSAESGVETDQDARYQEELRLVSVIPNKMVYHAQEKIALLFNNTLPIKGSYRVEFKGCKREKMDVKAKRINHCTLVVVAPVYYPEENVHIHVRHITHEGSTSIGQLPFQFISRVGLIGSLLEDCDDPVTFMCEALGISSSDMIALDKALAVSFKANIPPGFHLLGLRNHDIGNDTSSSLYPTLLHFASAFGLYHFAKDCLCHCPGVTEATKLRNCKGQRPSDIAHKGQFSNLNELLTAIEEKGDESIYEAMNESVNENEDIYYTRMSCQGYINLQLWQQSANEVSQRSQDGEFYEDMTQVLEDETDPEGYMKSSPTADFVSEKIYTDMESGSEQYETDPEGYMKPSHTGDFVSEEIYTDMESGSEQYVDVASPQHTDGGYVSTSHLSVDGEELYINLNEDQEGLYEPMTDNAGASQEGRYAAIPSNLPVSAMYPSARSVSMSLKKKPDIHVIKTPSQQKARGPPLRTRPREEYKQRPPSAATFSIASGVSDTSSGVSTSTTGSGFEGDNENDDDRMMSRAELLKKISEKPDSPPPVPMPDYQRDKSPSTSPTPRVLNRKAKERSRTLPLNQSDVESATTLIAPPTASRPSSFKGSRTRPHLTERPTSDIAPAETRPPQPIPNNSRIDNRRSSEGVNNIVAYRPQAPSPGPRPTSVASRQGVPSPFAQVQQLSSATQQQVSEPPPPSVPPRTGPRPAVTPRHQIQRKP